MRSMISVFVLLLLAACAPDNLDITPTPIPTEVPVAGATAAGPTAAEVADAAASDANRVKLDSLIALIPDEISAGQVTWQKTKDESSGEEIIHKDEAGGVTAKVFYREGGGSKSELTIGVFNTAELAKVFFDAVKERTRTLENAEERDNRPKPNWFGSGTYGSDAIFLQQDIYIRVSVPQFSSTLGEPLGPYSRAVLELLKDVLPTT
jgi:hypothetical protein